MPSLHERIEANAGRLQCFAFVYVISIILIATSFQSMELLEMGIAKNSILSKIKPNYVYLGGVYFLGIGYEFIKYPATNINVDIVDMTATTYDKQPVTLDVSAQYKLNAADLHKLYKRLGVNYEAYFSQQVIEAIKQVTVNYETDPDFYQKRVEISETIRLNIASRFSKEQASLSYFQLRRVDFPATVEKSIINIAVKQEETRSSIFTNSAKNIRNEASAKAKEGESNAKLKNDEAKAKGLVLTGEATADAFSTRTTAATDAVVELANGLDFSPAQVSKLMHYDAIHANKHKTSINVGLENFMENLLTARES
jgi:hypothetical protein